MFRIEVKMTSLETKKQNEEADVLCNGSQIPNGFHETISQTLQVDADNSLQLPLKKRNIQRKPTAKLNGNNMLATDRVTRISSGTIKPKIFADFCNLPIRNKKQDVNSSPAKGGPHHSRSKEVKHLISDDDVAQIMEVQGLNKRTDNRVNLLNSNTRLCNPVSRDRETVLPSSSSLANLECSKTQSATQKSDEAGKLASSSQQRGRKRKYDIVISTNDNGRQQCERSVYKNSRDSKQSQDVILDEVATECRPRNQRSDVSDESCVGGETVAENKPKCAKLDKTDTEVKSKYTDTACISPVDNASKKVARGDEAKKEEASADVQVCLEGVNEQCKTESPLFTCQQHASDIDKGLQISNALNPGKNVQSEAKRSQKEGPRKRQNFRCMTCKLRFFETKDELEVHLECHVGNPGSQELYQCKLCPYSSPFWNRILSHIIVHDEYKKRLAETKLAQNILGKFLCPECDRSFERKVNMQGHLKKVHFKENHTCDQCGLTLNGVDRKTFARHQEKCRNVKITCTFCDYTTTVTANMQKHMKIHNGEGFACTTCSAVFPTRQRLQVHLLTHQTDRPRYGCEYCGMMFVSEDSVKKHCARLHQNIQRSIPCPHCPYTARIQVDLKKHIQAVHEKKHKCPDCLYSTNSDHAIEQHKSYHSADRIFACSVPGCFYRGSSAKQVAVHNSSVHHLSSKHQCPVCKKYYKKKTHLLRHLVSHTGDRAYTCLECGQSFFSHSSYYRHRRRTRHDENRETIASIPQNITIQYLDESAEVSENMVEVKPIEEAASNAEVLYEQILQSGEPLLRGSSSARLELTSLLTKSNPDLLLGEAKGKGSAITYLVEVKRDPNGGSNQTYYAISEKCNSALEQGFYIGSTADGSLENVSSVIDMVPSSSKDHPDTPQYALVMMPKNDASQ